ncbi:glycoside hydrolase family 36 protein [Paenibacillus riograndensis]|uniref:Glycoside hydrolase clan GH-D n=2 Tax=Paenibacillus riograndensis TaxID=483937 RepID=A0A0E3WIW1_9BACL|nr:glycoside hydrolase family 36 protein [Paenibacillus riograndensis]CQR57728.1 glycoside hydrolase clan GH-D [Paenibacillus riograndensis SBR5]
MHQLQQSDRHYQLSGAGDDYHATVTLETPEAGIELVHIRLTTERPAVPPVIRLAWEQPITDIHGVWHPNGGRNRGIIPDWGAGYVSKLTVSSPVVCLFSGAGRNRMTFAFSDTLNPVECKAGVHEETAVFHCSVTLFEEPMAPFSSYEATLRVDCRDLAYYDSLNHVQMWWSGLPGLSPSSVPAPAREPMYSTWYSFHQKLAPAEVEEMCRLAKGIGCESVIMDDGWQTSDNSRGYAYCGDWEVCVDKIPDMKAHVQRVHGLGMKYLLWYSVPFIGMKSKAWGEFEDKMLYTIESRGWGIVDPRFPEIREYLIGIYETAMRNWDLDGFKLDFVDSFNLPKEAKHEYGNGRDYISVPDAVDRLMTDILMRLRRIKPDVMIEFRQAYVGPYMRKYGNMFRAADCPNDSVENRVRTIDIRLLCGNTAAHADPIMWNPGDPVESAALQLISVLFAVPQISVRLDLLPVKHREMTAFWLDFWKEHRAVLLDGHLEPHHPELLYPLVEASNEDTLITAAYERTVVTLNRELPETVILVNGTRTAGMVVELDRSSGQRTVEVLNCTGQVVEQFTQHMEAGIHLISVPPGGVVSLRARRALFM